ncbi:hypothetical protein EJ08DRAFT_734787 [Tothia fuscella]|uniref:Uncharacterized protein n=1 Tax=Tothia fuscella TaxID=1048955 RepID=A0A9P4NQ21_9PEZI|nr:hypothetical protein EJ08DRAFT_734787 [Tothia fuscella]
MTSSNTAPSGAVRASALSFLSLPAEIRNQIYRLVYSNTGGNDTFPNPALIRTCKQIYVEAFEMYLIEQQRVTMQKLKEAEKKNAAYEKSLWVMDALQRDLETSLEYYNAIPALNAVLGGAQTG